MRHRGTNWLNAAPFFFKKDDNIPAADKNPQLHRYIRAATFGGPIIKDKLFGFVGYQHLHISDQETGDELLDVPPGLSDTNRTAGGLDLIIANNNWTTNEGYSANVQYPENPAATTVTFSGLVDKPVGLALFTATGLPRQSRGNWLIPNQNAPRQLRTSIRPTTHFCRARRASPPTRRSPISTGTSAPRTYWPRSTTTSTIPTRARPTPTRMFPDLRRTWTPARRWARSTMCRRSAPPSASLRRSAFSARRHTPRTISRSRPHERRHDVRPSAVTSPASRSTTPSAISIDSPTGPLYGLVFPSLAIGPDSEYQGANTGVFQNRIMPSGTAIWAKGRHSVSFGGSWSYTQLNMRDRRTGTGNVASPDFVALRQ